MSVVRTVRRTAVLDHVRRADDKWMDGILLAQRAHDQRTLLLAFKECNNELNFRGAMELELAMEREQK